MHLNHLVYNRNFLSIALALMITLGFSACKTSQKLTGSNHESTENISVQKPAFYLRHRLLYKTFSGRAAMHVITGKQNQNITIVLDIHKNKDILASIRAMGMLEIFRAYATPDSLFALNRLKKEAYTLSYSEGTKLLNADMPFESLQNLFVGSPLLPLKAPIIKTELNDSFIVITQQKGIYIQTLYYDLRTQVLNKLQLKAINRPFQCTILYKNYETIGIGQPFAYNQTIQIVNKGEKTSIELNYSQAQINVPINTNFRIPGSYKIIHQI